MLPLTRFSADADSRQTDAVVPLKILSALVRCELVILFRAPARTLLGDDRSVGMLGRSIRSRSSAFQRRAPLDGVVPVGKAQRSEQTRRPSLVFRSRGSGMMSGLAAYYSLELAPTIIIFHQPQPTNKTAKQTERGSRGAGLKRRHRSIRKTQTPELAAPVLPSF